MNNIEFITFSLRSFGVKDDEYAIQYGYVYYHEVMLARVTEIMSWTSDEFAGELNRLRASLVKSGEIVEKANE